MPDSKGNLYIYETIAEIKRISDEMGMIKGILEVAKRKKDSQLFGTDELQLSKDVDKEALETKYDRLSKRKIKLSHALKEANFTKKGLFKGSEISIAEAIETRFSLKTENDDLYENLRASAFDRVIRKEERDIVIPSGIDYRKSHDKYMQILDDYKDISNLIHRLNHSEVVNFKDE
ncbi:MAG: hypothetical protein A2015_14335 [Spirochaetes bacterium GWF1_31_7]|nr:MAG: hypothetical protein A2Y30_03415 [Spirochaetes bacterium GWE1_32_154]OHD45456.1 MAG: hypothetical protein A2Y29_01405 [Spirochaetes bacterium GWE2_31_10]OHD50579.1 MAG: hypothetical protein A2015_14335 [Spirochaetes bacterium GWF1_31_7]OHD81557.1 MAG: hypothetical protein A2355_02405 [Spirochaetes bacterium RIFOXYB1_FULL_32_8]HBD94567.1 hypothetical protein [Spirochaetia bacterium]